MPRRDVQCATSHGTIGHCLVHRSSPPPLLACADPGHSGGRGIGRHPRLRPGAGSLEMHGAWAREAMHDVRQHLG